MKYNQQNKHQCNETEEEFDLQTPFTECLLCEEDDYRCLSIHSAMDNDICGDFRPAVVLCANCYRTLQGEDFLGKTW
jgi:hypothetical protein